MTLDASDDPQVLESALRWLDKCQSVMSDRKEMEPRAKLLQKLGRTQEAIACQEKAIALTLAEYQKDHRDPAVEVAVMNATLNKLKNGKPSWLPDTSRAGEGGDARASPLTLRKINVRFGVVSIVRIEMRILRAAFPCAYISLGHAFVR
jgi:hypothetical protein